jgi:tRNA threonylcarbamoyladenosine biosynthesis protein TsaE
MPFMRRIVRNGGELQQLAADLFAHLPNSAISNQKSAIVMGLSGELGAGKTTFTQAIAATLGVAESVTSPTFVILKIYALENQPFERLVHIDAYRLESGTELLTLGFDDLLRDPGNIIVVEWPEKVAEALPEERISVSIIITGEEEREMVVSNL